MQSVCTEHVAKRRVALHIEVAWPGAAKPRHGPSEVIGRSTDKAVPETAKLNFLQGPAFALRCLNGWLS
ncbi:hypothetical protein AGR9A_Lc40443 [Agrobacterium salinitolerans str. Hayward 0363]|nr:hypothetical protein AGR9A_Lc40443 [Agrobacterium salinitolerans str. Hayward 0363]